MYQLDTIFYQKPKKSDVDNQGEISDQKFIYRQKKIHIIIVKQIR